MEGRRTRRWLLPGSDFEEEPLFRRALPPSLNPDLFYWKYCFTLYCDPCFSRATKYFVFSLRNGFPPADFTSPHLSSPHTFPFDVSCRSSPLVLKISFQVLSEANLHTHVYARTHTEISLTWSANQKSTIDRQRSCLRPWANHQPGCCDGVGRKQLLQNLIPAILQTTLVWDWEAASARLCFAIPMEPNTK